LGGVLLLIPCHILIVRKGWQSRFSPLVFSSGADVPVRHAPVVPFLCKLAPMTNSSSSVLRKKWPLLALVLAAIVALILVIWQLQTSPETNDAYVYADTIDVVPEVSGGSWRCRFATTSG
jgi:multidrug efflux system membrane fusion protein